MTLTKKRRNYTVYVVQFLNKAAGFWWPLQDERAEYSQFAAAVRNARKWRGKTRVNEYVFANGSLSSVCEVWRK